MNPHIHAVMLLMLLVQLHAASVTESGKPAGEAKGVKFLRMENNAAVYAVGSGDYQFQSPLPSVTLHAENAPPAPERNPPPNTPNAKINKLKAFDLDGNGSCPREEYERAH